MSHKDELGKVEISKEEKTVFKDNSEISVEIQDEESLLLLEEDLKENENSIEESDFTKKKELKKPSFVVRIFQYFYKLVVLFVSILGST